MKKLIAGSVIFLVAAQAYSQLTRVPVRMIDMAGAIVAYPGATPPDWCLLPYGQVVSQTTYARVYAAYGTTYNTGGEGAGNFRLPDLRGRAIFGKDNMGGSTAGRVTNAVSGITGTTLGATGGNEALHQHNHGLNSHTHDMADHTHSGTTSTDSNIMRTDISPNLNGSSGTGFQGTGSTNTFYSHSHTITTGGPSSNTTGAASGNTANSGTASSANMPPAFIANVCILI